MQATFSNRMPIRGFCEGCILSGQGNYTVPWCIHKPEIFTLSAREYETIHQSLTRSFDVFSVPVAIHFQDRYLQVSYQPDAPDPETSWLDQASERFFNERPWLDHDAWLFVTLRTQPTWSNSAISGLFRPHLVPRESLDGDTIRNFLLECEQFAGILSESGYLQLQRLGEGDIFSEGGKPGILEQYFTLQPGSSPVLKDIQFNNGVRLGDWPTRLYTLADAADLPPICCPYNSHQPYSSERQSFPIGFASSMGPLLPHNHIVNQYIFLGDEQTALNQFESRRLRLQALSRFSRRNAVSADAIESFLGDAAQGRKYAKAHLNLFVWADKPGELPDIHRRASSSISRLGATARLETTGAPQIWWAGIPGNAGDFPINEAFSTFTDVAACLLQYEGISRSCLSLSGVRLCDRLTGRPQNIDIDHAPRASYWTSNYNTVAIGTTGAGKSFFLAHLLHTYKKQGAHVMVIDIGHSYELLCMYLGGRYITYDENNPVKLNPFRLGAGETLDTEKKESLKALLLALWKTSDARQNRSEYVAISSALQLYYDKLDGDPGLFPCFNTFYEFLRNDYRPFLEAEEIKEKDFDISNFLYTLKPYYKGGEFDYLLNAEEDLNLLQEPFIVFELDKIRKHPILYTVTALTIMELYISKMRNLDGIFKVLCFEETWTHIAQQGEYMRYFEKTVRKFFGKIIMSSQELHDLVSSEVLKETIVNCSDTKIILDIGSLRNNFDQLQKLFGLNDHQKAQILSLNKGHEPGSRYKDVYIGLGTSHSRVYRLEVSPEEYFVYTSEQKEKVRIKEYIHRFGGIKQGISALIADLKKPAANLLILILLALSPLLTKAQLPTGIITSGISRVIKAFDLQVQRMQTQTVLLQQAQKIVENAMSELRLADIHDWLQQQKDLYDGYFQELWQVRTILSSLYRIGELVRRQQQIVAGCRQSLTLFAGSGHFSPAELSHMSDVYSGILRESLANLDQLALVTRSFTTQMSDEARMSIISRTADGIERSYRDLARFNNQNAQLSLQRSAEADNILLLKKLYGL